MTEWKLKLATNEEVFPYVVYKLDENQYPIPFTGRSFNTLGEAIHIAKLLNSVGHNVVVFQELAYCTKKERVNNHV